MNTNESGPVNEGRPLRLQVFMARSGAASRRASEGLILAGRVAVNGTVVRELGTKVGEGDAVTLDGRPLRAETRRRYLALHKPPGYLCSSKDPQGRSLALSLLPPEMTERLYSVGRLDYLSSGLVFFTNDGAFAALLGHPSSGVEKEYLVEAAGPVPDQTIEAFEAGIVIEGERYRARRVERLGRGTLRIILIEGKNREIRRVFSHFHLHAAVLRRVRIGPVELGDLPEGASRPLQPAEIAALTAAPAETSR